MGYNGGYGGYGGYGGSGCGGYQPCGGFEYEECPRRGCNTFALLVVLFILLIIIGAHFNNHKKC